MTTDLKKLSEAEQSALAALKADKSDANIDAWISATGAFHKALGDAYRSGALVEVSTLRAEIARLDLTPDDDYGLGWNDAIEEVLAALPQPPEGEQG